jgi:hypothetical protein
MVWQSQYLFYVKHVTGVLLILIPAKLNKCPTCGNTSISTFPILPNEEFTFNYNEKRGVELEFGLKKSKDRAKGK